MVKEFPGDKDSDSLNRIFPGTSISIIYKYKCLDTGLRAKILSCLLLVHQLSRQNQKLRPLKIYHERPTLALSLVDFLLEKLQ